MRLPFMEVCRVHTRLVIQEAGLNLIHMMSHNIHYEGMENNSSNRSFEVTPVTNNFVFEIVFQKRHFRYLNLQINFIAQETTYILACPGVMGIASNGAGSVCSSTEPTFQVCGEYILTFPKTCNNSSQTNLYIQSLVFLKILSTEDLCFFFVRLSSRWKPDRAYRQEGNPTHVHVIFSTGTHIVFCSFLIIIISTFDFELPRIRRLTIPPQLDKDFFLLYYYYKTKSICIEYDKGNKDTLWFHMSSN